MSITLELLDANHQESNSTIIVGGNILLKFIPGTSALDQRPRLREIVDIVDLPRSQQLVGMKEIIKLSRGLKNVLGEYVQDYSNKKEVKTLLEKKKALIDISGKIANLERNMGVALCEYHQLIFCTKCNAYIGEADNLTTRCSECTEAVTDSGKLSLCYLDKISTTFLEGGIWFEDYMCRLLENEGWKVWAHGSVMGTSGILHPIDILAVREGRVMIAECKAGYVSPRDISHFMIQKNDIPSYFGLFLSLQNCSTKNTANLFKVSTSSLIDDIDKKTDSSVVEVINKHIDKFK